VTREKKIPVVTSSDDKYLRVSTPRRLRRLAGRPKRFLADAVAPPEHSLAVVVVISRTLITDRFLLKSPISIGNFGNAAECRSSTRLNDVIDFHSGVVSTFLLFQIL